MRFILVLLSTRQAVPDHSVDERGSVVFGCPEQSSTDPVLSLQHIIPFYRTEHTSKFGLHLTFQIKVFQHTSPVDYPVSDRWEDLAVLHSASRVGTSVDSVHRAHDKFSLIYPSDKVITRSPQSHDVLPALLKGFSVRPPRHPQHGGTETSPKSRTDQMKPELLFERRGAKYGVGQGDVGAIWWCFCTWREAAAILWRLVVVGPEWLKQNHSYRPAYCHNGGRSGEQEAADFDNVISLVTPRGFRLLL